MTILKRTSVMYAPEMIICPGETLLEILEERGMTQAEFAKRTGRPIKTINEIIKGKSPVTPETAFQFEQVLGVPASFWNKLEADHREILTRMEAEKEFTRLVDKARQYPYKEMAANGWVKPTINPVQQVENLLSFFGATSFDNIVETGAFRLSTKQKHSLPSITAWLRQGSIEGASIETKEFNQKKLRNSVTTLRALTQVENPDSMMNQIKEILTENGIAFVLTKGLPKAPINGATRWLTPNKALLQMSIRNSYADIFWFSLFHEIGHILLGNKKDFTVDLRHDKYEEKTERQFDEFAREALIPSCDYETFVKFIKTSGSYKNIYPACKQFAHQIDIHPGIVLGRLQYDHILKPNMNKLRTQFKWTE